MTIVTHTATSLADMKAAATSDISIIYDKSLWTWTPSDFTGQSDDRNIIKADSTPVSNGAWIRQRSEAITQKATSNGTVRTVQARLVDVVSVKDFGAIGDGATQDSTAFQATSNYLSAGGGIDVPGGTYKVGEQFIAPSRGNSHAYDTAIIGAAEVVTNPGLVGAPPSGWTLSNFSAANPGITKSSTAAGSAKIAITVAPSTLYVLALQATTTAKGGLAIYLDGNPASNIDDFPMHPVGELTRRFYVFSYNSTGNVTLEVRAEPRWTGSITKLSLIRVQRETPYDFFSIPADRRDFGNLLGIKFGRFLAGNMAIGDRSTQALLSDKAAWNVALGSRSNASTIDGFENTAIGCFTLEFNQVSRNSAFGYSAFRSNITGEQNTGIGYKAFVSNTTGGNNTGAGFHASLYNRDGSNNSTFGTLAAYYNESGSYNCAFGSQAGLSNDGGSANTYVGAIAGPYPAAGEKFSYNYQVCIGAESKGYGNNVTSVGGLSRVGTAGGPTLSGGVAVGYDAVVEKDESVAVGMSARTTQIRSTSIGHRTQGTGANSVALGFLSSAEEQCTSLGSQSGVNLAGANNTSVGYGANSFATPNSRTNANAFGYGAICTADNQVTLGNLSVGSLRCAVTTITAISDRRDKAEITPIDGDFACRFIDSLDPVRWRWAIRGNDQREGGDVGFVAQDLMAAQQACDAEWLGLVDCSNPDRLEATPGRLIPVLAAALKEALTRIQRLEASRQ